MIERSEPAARGDGAVDVPTPEPILADVFVFINQTLKEKFAIEQGEYILGRDPTCHMVIDVDEVSRHHARLTLNGFELLIEDTGSSNGVFIDGVQVQIPTRVRADQEIQIGMARLRVGLRESAARQLAEALWDADLGLEPVRQMLAGTKYRVVTTIGRGGMGMVMQARDMRIRRTVAMKVMKTGTQFSRENLLRFIDEAQLTGQLEHPNIVPVYELGIDEQGETFYVMKHVRGTTLDEVLRGLRDGHQPTVEKYPLAMLVGIFQKICDAVAFAHSKAVVHRDLKPENVMIGAYGEVLVMDWGLAKHLAHADHEPTSHGEFALEAAMQDGETGRGFETMTGLVVGTPPYVSPEQARGELDKVDARSDVFVLGEILYAILTLRAPVVGHTVMEVLEKILSGVIAPPSSFEGRRRPDTAGGDGVELVHCPGQRVPPGLSAVAMKAMELEPGRRYQSVEEMQADITAWQGGFPTKAERASLIQHLLLFMGRHKGEVALVGIAFVLFNVVVLGFIYELSQEKKQAQGIAEQAERNRELAEKNAQLADERLNELRGVAPTYYDEAQNLVEDRKFEEALGKVDYAIQQVPNAPDYHLLRGHILQSLFRWDDAVAAYRDAFERNPKLEKARLNLDFTQRLLTRMEKEGLSMGVLLEFEAGLIAQKRFDEANAAMGAGRSLNTVESPWRALLSRHNFKGRISTNEDGSLHVDLNGFNPAKNGSPHWNQLVNVPIGSMALDDAKLNELGFLRDFKLRELSINRTTVTDLRPLAGMPLKSFSAENTPLADIKPLEGMPLETLRIGDTKVMNLQPLRKLPLKNLSMAGCQGARDLAALSGLRLVQLDLSRTPVEDLTPLAQMPLKELVLDGCPNISDLRVLLKIPSLERVVLPGHAKEINFLRDHPGLRWITRGRVSMPVERFWKEGSALDGKPLPPPAGMRPGGGKKLFEGQARPERPSRPEGSAIPVTADKPADEPADKPVDKPVDKPAAAPQSPDGGGEKKSPSQQ